MASIADFVAGTGINRGSLYNAFGGKEQLLVKALLKYDQENYRAMLSELEAMDDPWQTITTLFDGIVAIRVPGRGVYDKPPSTTIADQALRLLDLNRLLLKFQGK